MLIAQPPMDTVMDCVVLMGALIHVDTKQRPWVTFLFDQMMYLEYTLNRNYVYITRVSKYCYFSTETIRADAIRANPQSSSSPSKYSDTTSYSCASN